MQDKRQNLLFRWLIHSQIAPLRPKLRGAEAGIRLSAARTDLGGNAGSHGAGDGVAGTGGAVACLLCYHLLQSVLLLYLKEVRLLPLLLTDAIVDEAIDSLLPQRPPGLVLVVVLPPAEHHQAFRLGIPNVGKVLQQLLSVGTDSHNILTLGETYGDLSGLAADVHQFRILLGNSLSEEEDGVLVLFLTHHGADIWVKAGEDNTSFPASLQDTGQDDIQVGIHVEVGG